MPMKTDMLWQRIQEEARQAVMQEPSMADFYQQEILDFDDLASALAHRLGRLLASPTMSVSQIADICCGVFQQTPAVIEDGAADIEAYVERDAACDHYSMPLLYFKGFHALQAYRVAHQLWVQGRRVLALFFQNAISQTFAVDIHPAARIGKGIMIDHATGVVIGETAVVEDNVSMLHGVTLGGVGTDCGKDRHPKIRQGVLISTGANVLGCVEVGEGAKIGAGSLVLKDVPPHTTVAGVPAKIVGKPAVELPALGMDHQLGDND
ncbi:MAG: serine O-acetyltransferase [Pseudomonadales bacterium]|nr:serine O-acetyltransferase [Pseudomonadales bacterium]